MRILLLVFCLTVSVGHVAAQKPLNYDITFGVHYPDFNDLPFDYKAEIGIQGGLRMWYNIKEDFAVGIEVQYIQTKYGNDSGAYLKADYIGLPLLVKRSFPSDLYVIAGFGYAGFGSSREKAYWPPGASVPAPVSALSGYVYLPARLGYSLTNSLFMEAGLNWGLSKMEPYYGYSVTPLVLHAGFRL